MQLLKLGEVSGVSPSNKHDINISTVYLTDLLLLQYCMCIIYQCYYILITCAR